VTLVRPKYNRTGFFLTKKFSSNVSSADNGRLCGLTVTHRTTLTSFESASKIFSRASMSEEQSVSFCCSLIFFSAAGLLLEKSNVKKKH